MKHAVNLVALISFLSFASAEEPIDIEKYRVESVKKWEKAIEKFEVLDKEESHPDHSILFVGSSSIRKWDSIREDLAPYHPIRRGFGGSRFSDLAIYAERLIAPHKFKAVVIFVGNDITGNDNDETPEQVARLFSYFHGKVREHNATAPIFYIAVTPTAARASCWTEARAANTAIRKVCQKTRDTYFIGTESIFLDTEGKSKTELFIGDKLHLNEAGYKLWAAAIKSHLDSVLNGAK